jgi:multiple sugar transport system permease protein
VVLRTRPAPRLPPTAAVHALLLPGAVAMLAPFFWMATTSLKAHRYVFAYPPQIIPNPIVFQNYTDALTELPVALAYFNSLKIAVLVTGGTLLTCSLAGYAFAKLRFRGRDALFLTILATMMIPGQITLLPAFVFYQKIGWLNTHYPLIVPGVLTNPFGVFLMRQFLRTVPTELEDAARVDGANPLRIYWSLMLPLIKPALATLGIFTFMGSWNDFLAPLIFLSSPSMMTVPVLLASFRGVYGTTEWGPLMAASCMAVAPVLAVYAFAQRYFVEGITLTGLKG